MKELLNLLENLRVNGKFQMVIDTDPGVDDSACLIYTFIEKAADVKLLTTVSGNVSVSVSH
jgi:inosine-uridine nucleoside N-ribohydrolase